ncbi:hypothetical protein BOTBODRAFT_340714 [Botryobasidium botryosum FD-172 SS1]|uniref:Uncharacterized protein n=1 Tax=Botryobasidium botryosum (strain FD-172 SS1) TaxID=930990 RepID=A0A067MJ77_BOTB1|nr:hypothetical protein BOTBODRAFT_340714 [Botryobasidium botryosum FD-172 SS1]
MGQLFRRRRNCRLATRRTQLSKRKILRPPLLRTPQYHLALLPNSLLYSDCLWRTNPRRDQRFLFLRLLNTPLPCHLRWAAHLPKNHLLPLLRAHLSPQTIQPLRQRIHHLLANPSLLHSFTHPNRPCRLQTQQCRQPSCPIQSWKQSLSPNSPFLLNHVNLRALPPSPPPVLRRENTPHSLSSLSKSFNRNSSSRNIARITLARYPLILPCVLWIHQNPADRSPPPWTRSSRQIHLFG